jgi:hypothetical protein
MTGSVMKATRGTEPAIYGAAETTPVVSALSGAARPSWRRPSSPPVSWAALLFAHVALTTSTPPAGQGRDCSLQRLGWRWTRRYVLGMSKLGSVPPRTGTARSFVAHLIMAASSVAFAQRSENTSLHGSTGQTAIPARPASLPALRERGYLVPPRPVWLTAVWKRPAPAELPGPPGFTCPPQGGSWPSWVPPQRREPAPSPSERAGPCPGSGQWLLKLGRRHPGGRLGAPGRWWVWCRSAPPTTAAAAARQGRPGTPGPSGFQLGGEGDT